MLNDLAPILGVALAAAVFAWLAWRAFRTGKPLIKWSGTILAGLLALILALVAVVAGVGIARYQTRLDVPVPQIEVQGTPEQIARGEHIASVLCVDCHSVSREFPMIGGRDLARDIPLPLGRFVSANLTPGGAIKDWSDGEIFRALRNGVDREGRPLTVMLTTNVRYMSDDDMLAVIAFLRSQQPVENAIPPEQVSLLGSFLGGANLTPQKPAVTAPIVAPEKAPTAEYGHYLTTFLDCRDCHGADLNGGTSQFAPIGPTLRIVKGWSQDEFISTLRTGVDPSGHTLSVLMPWKASGRMDDTELSALYQYLVSLP